MTTIQTIHQYRCDLNQGPSEVTLKTPIMHQDSLGDVFRVAVWRGNKVVDLTGMTVRGFLYFASTRQTLLLEGSITDNCACVTLTSECYAIPGYASLVVQVQSGDVRHSLLKVNMCITRTGSESVIDPGNILPTLADLLGQIAAMEQATDEAVIAATKANAARAGIEGDLAALSEEMSTLNDTEKAVNLFDYRTATINVLVDNGIETTVNGYYCSDYIQVKPNTYYCIPFTSSLLCSLYNENKDYIGNVKRDDYAQPSTKYSIIKTNATTAYIRVNGYNGGGAASINVSPTKYMVVEGQEYPQTYRQYKEATLSDGYKASNYLYGKTIMTYGDSITEGVAATVDEKTGYRKTYAGIVAKRNGMNFINLGWAGSTMADDGQKPFIHNGQIYPQFDNKLVTPDYITVWFGWNDYAHAQKGTGITLGTISSEDESTYYGAYIKACKLLIQKFPKARIGLVVPYGMDADWRDAVRIVAKKFGLPYLDLYNNCPCIYNDEDGVNTDIANLRQSTFLADGTHPNDDGYEWLSTAYEDFLRRI